MSSNFLLELEDLQQEILKMGVLVEKGIHDAVDALARRDLALAKQVIAGDDLVDDWELKIERHCISILARQAPVAGELRVVSTALKIVTDLERMADHATDIAKVSVRLGEGPLMKPLIDIPRMAEIAESMVREALTAYVQRDVDLAHAMIDRDDSLDHLYGQVFRELLTFMAQDPQTINQGTHLLMVAQYLERIGDHATNLGEWIIYMVTGERLELNR